MTDNKRILRFQLRGPFKSGDTVSKGAENGFFFSHIAIQAPFTDARSILRHDERASEYYDALSREELFFNRAENRIDNFIEYQKADLNSVEGPSGLYAETYFLEHGDLTINGKEYLIPLDGILEFDGLEEESFEITFNRDMPKETIIDMVCSFYDDGSDEDWNITETDNRIY